MINIDLDTPSDNCSCTFKCFRAVKLYKPVQKFYSLFNLLYLSTFKLQETWL